jgi:hypothetical protein
MVPGLANAIAGGPSFILKELPEIGKIFSHSWAREL